MKKSLFRLVFSLLLLLVAVFGFSRTVSACPHAVDIKYYEWGFVPGDPSSASYCSIPVISPPFQPGVTIFWILVGEETTDCDGNYSTWGDITTCSNTVRTSTTCSCSP
jgi:hypothetical protein